jgi:hypothetical protein
MAQMSEDETMRRMIDAMDTVVSAMTAIMHIRKDPRWVALRDMQQAMLDKMTQLATKRALTRQQVLSALDNKIDLKRHLILH